MLARILCAIIPTKTSEINPGPTASAKYGKISIIFEVNF